MKTLPDGWKKYKIKDIGTVVTGSTPPKNEPQNYDGDLPWIKPPDLDNGMFVSTSVGTISEFGRKKIRSLPKGSILVSCIGNIGKVAIAECELCTNQQINSIIPNREIVDSVYIYYAIKRIRSKLEEAASSFVVPLLNKTDFSNIELSFPPLPTQKKIAAILEKAEKLREWRKEADGLMDRFLKSTFLEMFGDPVENPKGWEHKKLMEIGNWQSGGTPSRSNGDYFKGDIPWYTAGELNSLFVYDSIEKITQDAIKESSAKLISPNNLLLGMYDTAALKSSITTVECACNQAIVFTKLEYGLANIFYLFYVIHVGRKHYMRQQRGVRQKNLNLSMIRNLEVPVPPIGLQNKFASIVQQVEQIREHQTQSRQHIENFFNVLMQRAFRGELEAK